MVPPGPRSAVGHQARAGQLETQTGREGARCRAEVAWAGLTSPPPPYAACSTCGLLW